MTLKTKMNSAVSYTEKIKEKENVLREEKNGQRVRALVFSERTSVFSLESWQVRPSEFFGTRRRATLRGETYAWAPDLRSFDKLREVGVSPHLGFILYLSTLLMFELNEAVRGHLIDPKTWDRIVMIFETSNG